MRRHWPRGVRACALLISDSSFTRKIPSPSPFHPSPLQPHIDTAIMEPNSIGTVPWFVEVKLLVELLFLNERQYRDAPAEKRLAVTILARGWRQMTQCVMVVVHGQRQLFEVVLGLRARRAGPHLGHAGIVNSQPDGEQAYDYSNSRPNISSIPSRWLLRR